MNELFLLRLKSDHLKFTALKTASLTSFLVIMTTFLTITSFAHTPNLNKNYEIILNSFQDFYVLNNLPLQIKIDETSSSIAASADYDGRNYSLIVNRALLNSNRLTSDGLRVILCHEVGHLFGGAPRKSAPPEWDGSLAPDGKSWMSAEGQSDYYATAACFRRFVKFEQNQQIHSPTKNSNEFTISNKDLQIANTKCKSAFSDENDREICVRATIGSINFLKLTFDFNISLSTPSHELPDKSIVENYPDRQCRLDNLFAGALCSDRLNLRFDLNNSTLNDCSIQAYSRSRCWYVK